MKTFNYSFLFVSVLSLTLLCSTPVRAQEKIPEGDSAKTVADMKEKMDTLSKRMDQMPTAKKTEVAIQPCTSYSYDDVKTGGATVCKGDVTKRNPLGYYVFGKETRRSIGSGRKSSIWTTNASASDLQAAGIQILVKDNQKMSIDEKPVIFGQYYDKIQNVRRKEVNVDQKLNAFRTKTLGALQAEKEKGNYSAGDWYDKLHALSVEGCEKCVDYRNDVSRIILNSPFFQDGTQTNTPTIQETNAHVSTITSTGPETSINTNYSGPTKIAADQKKPLSKPKYIYEESATKTPLPGTFTPGTYVPGK